MAKNSQPKHDAADLAKQAVREHLRNAGRKGGETMKKRGTEYYKMIGKKGALARWGKKTK